MKIANAKTSHKDAPGEAHPEFLDTRVPPITQVRPKTTVLSFPSPGNMNSDGGQTLHLVVDEFQAKDSQMQSIKQA